jgi:transposase
MLNPALRLLARAPADGALVVGQRPGSHIRIDHACQRRFEIPHLAGARGKSISEIARLTGRDRKTIRRLLREGGPTPRRSRQVSSKLDPFRQYLLGRVLGEDPVTNAEVLYDEIRECGYTGGRTILREFLHPFRQLAREKVPKRFETPPGRQAQVDWAVFKKPERRRCRAS